MSRTLSGIALLAAALCTPLGCAGRGEEPGGGGGGGGGTSGTGAGGSTANAGSPLLPARIRRLTNAEYDASVHALLSTNLNLAATTFPPDSRQSSFTVNDAQRVDPVLAKQLSDAAQTLAAEAAKNGTLTRLAPCANATSGGEACAKTFIRSFATQAFRRPVTTEEETALLAMYHAGADGAAYADGLDVVVRAVLQSASFLYLTEIGEGGGGAVVNLTPHEMASALSYLTVAGPPDQQLLDDATAGALADPARRAQHADRLLKSPAGVQRVIRLVREWLGIDGIGAIAKDTTVYPKFAELRASMDTESVKFIEAVLGNGGGSVSELLGADWSFVDAPLASFYGASGSGRVATGRRGILNQGAFLSVFAHASESGPVLRGVALMRRIGCLELASPTSLNIVVTPPVPDPSKTTRQRFATHATDDLCRTCHKSIDNFGFAFEGYDGMGAARPGGKDNGQPVDTSAVLATGADFDGSYADSNALAAALAASPSVRACMARQLFRGSAGRSDKTVTGAEEAFLKIWQDSPEAAPGNIVQTIVAYVKSPSFTQRRPN